MAALAFRRGDIELLSQLVRRGYFPWWNTRHGAAWLGVGCRFNLIMKDRNVNLGKMFLEMIKRGMFSGKAVWIVGLLTSQTNQEDEDIRKLPETIIDAKILRTETINEALTELDVANVIQEEILQFDMGDRDKDGIFGMNFLEWPTMNVEL